jgi:hypothetical protein
MSERREWIPIAGLFATMAMVAYMVVQLGAQAPIASADFRNASVAEVRDAQGAVVLQGQFGTGEEDSDDDDAEVERKAAMKAQAGGPTGEAEVEFAKAGTVVQEVEFSVRGLQPGATYTFAIDGQAVATATADQRGRAEAELDVRMPGAPAPKQP